LEELEAETPAASDDASAANGEPSSPIEQSSPPGRKKSARRALPAHLPCREVVHEPSCTCPTCGGEMRKVGEDVTQVLDYVPGHFEVVKHIRPALSCRRCESMASRDHGRLGRQGHGAGRAVGRGGCCPRHGGREAARVELEETCGCSCETNLH
jgi:transposase IS66-like protein